MIKRDISMLVIDHHCALGPQTVIYFSSLTIREPGSEKVRHVAPETPGKPPVFQVWFCETSFRLAP